MHSCIVSTCPRSLEGGSLIRLPRGSILARVIDDLVDVPGHPAEVAPLHAAQDVHDGREVVGRADGRTGAAVQRGQVDEELVGRAVGAGDRQVQQVVERLDAVLRGRRGEVVDDVVLLLRKNDGETWKELLNEVSRLFATSRSVRPSWFALERSTFRSILGWLKSW